jgi:hypothetical protein
VARTGNQLLTSLSRYIGDLDFPEGLVTTAAGSSTSLVDTLLGRFNDDYLIDWFARITENINGNQYLARRISDFVASTGTCTLSTAFPGATASGTDYELHRIAPAEKFSALDEARIPAYPALGVLAYSDTLTGDGVQRTFDIPSAIRRGPITTFIERPVATGVDWNFLGNPNGDSLTGWTAGSLTAAIVAAAGSDNVIPKYGETSCTSFTVATATAATYTQTVSGMTTVTAAAAAGRKMTFAAWVYATTVTRIRLGITDAVGTTYGSYHGGGGWELLTVEKTIAGNNTVTLSALFDMPSGTGAMTYFWQRGWFYYGAAEKVVESWRKVKATDVRRDNTTQQFTLAFIPARGLQLRLVGRGLLTELGNTPSTQATNTMEVDEAESEILCAEATKILFQRGALSYAAMQALAGPMALNEQRLKEMKSKWKQSSPGPRVTSMWSS